MMQANTKATSAEHGYPAINGERRLHYLQSRPSCRAAWYLQKGLENAREALSRAKYIVAFKHTPPC